MEARNAIAAVPGATARAMRFGLHLADVVVMGGDLRGDGVNVATRLQSAAEAGEIDVTGALMTMFAGCRHVHSSRSAKENSKGYRSRSGFIVSGLQSIAIGSSRHLLGVHRLHRSIPIRSQSRRFLPRRRRIRTSRFSPRA